jgi:hypothetical protein
MGTCLSAWRAPALVRGVRCVVSDVECQRRSVRRAGVRRAVSAAWARRGLGGGGRPPLLNPLCGGGNRRQGGAPQGRLCAVLRLRKDGRAGWARRLWRECQTSAWCQEKRAVSKGKMSGRCQTRELGAVSGTRGVRHRLGVLVLIPTSVSDTRVGDIASLA